MRQAQMRPSEPIWKYQVSARLEQVVVSRQRVGKESPRRLPRPRIVRSAVGLSGATGRGGGTVIGRLCFVVGTSLQ